MKTKSIIAIAMLVLASCGKPDDSGGSSPAVRSATVTAMSFNIRHTGEASDVGDRAWSNRKAAVVNMIKTESPDLIGFQECTAEQCSYLEEKLPEYGFYAPTNNKVTAYKKAKFDLLSNGRFWLCDTPNKAVVGWDAGGVRATAWMKLREKSSIQILYFFDTHLDVSGKKARIEGAKVNVEQMRMICGNFPQLIVGDMNTSEAACHENFRAYLSDARELSPETDSEATFNGWGNSGSMIDYIYYKNATPLCFKTLNGGDYGVKYVSDHYPILFKFEIRSK